MKTPLGLAFSACVVAIAGVCEAAAADDVVMVPLTMPIPVETAGENARLIDSARAVLAQWQAQNRQRELKTISLESEGGQYLGFKVTSAKVTQVQPINFAYVRCATPFYLPPGMTTESVLKEVWPKIDDAVDAMQAKAKPIKLITAAHADGRTVVHGVLYFYKLSFATSVRIDSADADPAAAVIRAREERVAKQQAVAALTMDLPKVVKRDPALYVVGYRASTAPGKDRLVMDPYKTVRKDFVGTLNFHYSVKGVTDYVEVKGLLPTSPHAKAGLKDGMLVWAINGASTLDIPRDEADNAPRDIFIARLKEIEGPNLNIEVSDSLKGEHRFVAVPLTELTKAQMAEASH